SSSWYFPRQSASVETLMPATMQADLIGSPSARPVQRRFIVFGSYFVGLPAFPCSTTTDSLFSLFSLFISSFFYVFVFPRAITKGSWRVSRAPWAGGKGIAGVRA